MYAHYWTLAVRTLERAQRLRHAVELVLFEDLVTKPAVVGQRLAVLLESNLVQELLPEGANTSFRSGPRKAITQTEEWLCEWMCGPEMNRLGYELREPSPRLRDVPDLLRTTIRFTAYQAARVLDRKGRVRILNFVRRAVQRTET